MNIFPKDSIPAKMLADLKNLIKRNAKFDKKTLLGLIPLLIFAWAGNKIYCAYRINGLTAEMITAVNAMFSDPMPSLNKSDLLAGLVTAAAFKAIPHKPLKIRKKNGII